MVRHIKIIFVFVITCFLLCGCSKLNPFAPPADQTDEKSSDDKSNDKKNSDKKNSDKKSSDKKSSKKDSDEYMKSVDKKHKKDKKTTDDIANKVSEKTDKIYYEAMDKYTAPDKHESDETITEYLLKSFYRTYLTIRLYAPGVFIGSVVVGILGMLFSRHNKGSRRLFLFSFIIGIPLIMILIVFGIGTLNNMFLYN